MALGKLIEELGIGGEVFSALSAFAETDLTATAALSKLREAGLSIGNEKGFKLYKALRSNIDARSYILNVKNSVLSNPDRYGEALTSTLRQYSYKVRINAVDSEGENAFTQYITISSNDVLTKEQIYSMGEDIAGNSNILYGQEFQSMTVVEALRQSTIGR